MKTWLSIMICLVLGVAALKAGEENANGGSVSLYDTGAPVKIDETVPSLVSNGWTRKTNGVVKGDAVLVNERVAAVVHGRGGIDLYAKSAGGWIRRAQLAVVAREKPVNISGLKAAAGGTGAAVEALVGGGVLVFSLDPNKPILKATSKGKVEALRIVAPCRLGVLPDFFADDLMMNARLIPIERTEIPSENMFLHMAGNGDALVAAMWEKNVRDIVVRLSGEGDARSIVSSDIFFGAEGGIIYAGVLEQKGVWYSHEIIAEATVKGVRFEEWAVPYMANWKGNFTREDGNVESMKFALRSGLEKKSGKLTIVVANKNRRIIEFGQENPKYTKEYASAYVGLKGVGVVYPITRAEDTPPERLCVDDLMRMSLGTGPCESILDLEARQPVSKGIFTCSYRAGLERFFPGIRGQEREIAMRMKEERYYIKRVNKNVLTFVTNVQNRINRYVDLGVGLMEYLDEQEKKRPEQSAFIEKLRTEWARPVWQYKKPFSNSEKSNNAEIAAEMMKPLYKAIRIDTPEQAIAGRHAGSLAEVVGDPGDRRLRNMRRKVMVMRAIATMEMAMNPGVAEIAREFRMRTEAALRNPHKYENVTVW